VPRALTESRIGRDSIQSVLLSKKAPKGAFFGLKPYRFFLMPERASRERLHRQTECAKKISLAQFHAFASQEVVGGAGMEVEIRE
jgi:hypothetical protein